MPLQTPQDLISFSLRAIGILGVGQSALAEDYQDAFSALNGMMGMWNRSRWLIYHLIDVSKVSTGAQSYTVGPGGDFDVPRPDRLEAAFFRQFVSSQPNKVDYPLQLLEAREDYNQIALKTLTSWPSYIFYDAAIPLGVVYPWPIPQASTYELHLTLKATLPQFQSYVQSVNLPDEYTQTIWMNLAIILGTIYPGSVISDDLRRMAKGALETIRAENTQVPSLKLPGGLPGRGSKYNIYSDRIYN